MSSPGHIYYPALGQLFIVNGKDIYFRQELVITLWCPMRFDFYPLDKQVTETDNPGLFLTRICCKECKFRIGSYQYRAGKVRFSLQELVKDVDRQNVLLEYLRLEKLQVCKSAKASSLYKLFTGS